MSATARSSCRFGVIALLSLLAAIAYLSRNAMSVFVTDPEFVAEFRTGDMTIKDAEAQFSRVMSAFFWVYALLQVPGGWLGQRLGTRGVLSFYMGACALLTVSMGFAHSILALMVIQAGIGATQAGMFPTAMRSVADWVPLHRRGLASGTIAAAMQIGAALTTTLVGYLLWKEFAWRQVVMWLAVPAAIWTVAFAVWFRNRPQEHPGVSESELSLIMEGRREVPTAAQAERLNWLAVLSCRSLWAINAQQFFRAAGYAFFATWFPKFLRESFGVDIKDAGWLASLPMVSILIGSVTGGWISDRLLKQTGNRRLARQVVAVVSLGGCALLIGATFWVKHEYLAIALIATATYFSGVAGCCSYTQTLDIAGRHVPVIFGLMNMLGNIGAAMCPAIVTWLVQRTDRWDSVLFLVSGIYLASTLSWLAVDPEETLE